MAEDAQLLLDYVRRGNVGSLTALVERQGRGLMLFLRGLLPNDADAEDAFQETWARVIRSAAYRGGSVRGYLLTVARSVVADRYRREPKSTVSIDAAGEDGEGLVATVPDPSLTPDAAFETAATVEEIRRAVCELPDGPRDVFLMRLEDAMSFKEISVALGVPLGTALTWMDVARRRLKRKLKGTRG